MRDTGHPSGQQDDALPTGQFLAKQAAYRFSGADQNDVLPRIATRSPGGRAAEIAAAAASSRFPCVRRGMACDEGDDAVPGTPSSVAEGVCDVQRSHVFDSDAIAASTPCLP
jgi:hypothetical protein